MEHMFKKILSLSLLFSASAVFAADCNNSCESSCDAPAKPVVCFTPRSQSFNNVIKNAGMDPDNQYLYDVDGFNGSFKLTFEYDHTFNGNKLGECLFGKAAICVSGCDDDAVALRIVGSQAGTVTGGTAPNGTTDLVADNFFLPKDFTSTVTIKPSIQNFNVHLQAYFGFDEWCTGLYLRVYAPITVSRWKLETNETVKTPAGTIGYAAGEISSVAVPVDELFTSFLQYTQGGNNFAFPAPGNETVQALRFTRFGSCETATTTQLADLRAEFGWNFLLDEDYHLGLYIHAAAPTANDCDQDCDTLLWGAKAGNGKHWELGGGISGHYTLWRAEDCEQQFDFCIDATISHMFKHTQNLTLDLKDKPLSRYIIAEKLTTATTGLTVGGTAAKFQFAGAYAPVANFTTLPVGISYPVQADVMAKFVYTCRGFSWGIGYDFWAQACPDIDSGNCDDDCNAVVFAENTWALRGDAHVYGFNDDTKVPVAIPATYNATTVFNIGTAFEGTTPNLNVNAGVDKAAVPVDIGTSAVVVSPVGISPDIWASNPPIFITADDLDVAGSATRGLSNSIFTELNYTWIDRECWVPYLGIGARVEFGSNGSGQSVANPNTVTTTTTTNNNCNDSCDSCDTCSVTKWGLWIQGGLSFN